MATKTDTPSESATDSPSIDSEDNRAQTGIRRLVPAILVIGIASIVGFIVVDVISEVDDSISVTTGSDFDNATNSISSGFTSAMDLIEVVFIVIMASVILAVLGGVVAFR